MTLLNDLRVNLYKCTEFLNDEIKYSIKTTVDKIVEAEIQRVNKLELIEIKAYQLRKGDLILDMKDKKLYKVSFVERRKNCQFNIDNDNNELLIMYGEDESADYMLDTSDVFILVNISNIVNINKRIIDEIPYEYDE